MLPSNPAIARSQGFTLIEMVLVILVVGIFAALAVPYASSAANSQLPSAMRILEADIAFAQGYSISHQDSQCAIYFEETRYYLALKSDPETPLTHPGDRQPYVMEFGKARASNLGRIRISSTTVGEDNKLSFGTLGQLDQTTPASITLTDGNATMTLTLDPITGLGSITQP